MHTQLEAGVRRIAGVTAICFGALTAIFGSFWTSGTLQLFSGIVLGPALEYLVPFLPIFLMLFGAYLLTNHRG